MPSVTLYPGTVSQTNNGLLTGIAAWSNITNVEADDGAVASVSMTSTSPTSYYILCSGYNFAGSIPSNGIPVGIQVGVKKSSSSSGSVASNIVDSLVQLIYGAGTLPVVGNDKHDGSTVWPGSLAYEYYGSSVDLWGWASADRTHICDSTFGVAVRASKSGSGDGIANIDAVPITVWWTGGTLSGAPILSGGQLSRYGLRTGGRLYRHSCYSFPSRLPGVAPFRKRIFER